MGGSGVDFNPRKIEAFGEEIYILTRSEGIISAGI